MIVVFSKALGIPRGIVRLHEGDHLGDYSVLPRQPVHEDLTEKPLRFQDTKDLCGGSICVKIREALHRCHRVKSVIIKARVLGGTHLERDALHALLSGKLSADGDLILCDIGRGKIRACMVQIHRQDRGTAAEVEDLLPLFADPPLNELLIHALGIDIAESGVVFGGLAKVKIIGIIDIR